MKGILHPRVRLGVFEVDLRAGELRQDEGAVLVLADQPLQILRILIEADGEIVSRDEIRQRLWPDDTVVEFDHSINNAIKKLRRALVDSGDEPHYIGTIAKRGYRLLVPVERVGFAEGDSGDSRQTADPSTSSAAADSARDDKGGIQAVAATPAAAAQTAPVIPAPDESSIHPAFAQPGTHSRWKWLAAAAMVCMAILAGVLYWRAHRVPKLTQRDTIVLADFDNKTGDPVFDDTLRQALSIHVEQSPILHVLSEDRMRDTLKFMKRPPGTRVTHDVAREVCLRSNGQAVLEGSIARIGDHYLVGLTAANCQTGDLLASSEEEAEDRNHVLAALSNASNQLRRNLGESLASLRKFNQPLDQVTTTSLEALEAYTQGQKVADSQGYDAAISYFKRAVELDPNFALAYRGLGNAYLYTWDNNLGIQNLKKAYELRDRVSEKERLIIEASYASATGQIELAIRTYNEWAHDYPDDDLPHGNLANKYRFLGLYDKAAAEALEACRIMPSLSNYQLLTMAYIALNRFKDAKQALRDAELHKIDAYPLRQLRYILAFLQDDSAVMEEQNRWAMGKPGAEALQLRTLANYEIYRGHYAKAAELSQRAEEAANRAGMKGLVTMFRTRQMLAQPQVGNLRVARQLLDQALETNAHIDKSQQTALALVLALIGDTAKAQALTGKMSQASPLDTMLQSYSIPTIQAVIDLARDNPRQAIQSLETVSQHEFAYQAVLPANLYPAYVRGLAYMRLGQGPQAAAEFQKVIDNPGILMFDVYGPLARLQLGRTQVLMGDKSAARKSYEGFLTLWKDADPDIPIYKQAKDEYAKLQ